MPLLAEIARTEGDDSPYVNYVVVPSFAGANLTERTCPHFDEWLASVSVKCRSPARSWIYDHGIRLERLESWDKYCTTGDELLSQLLVMQKKLCDDETIILIGHKLGCYILKKALITAWDREHKDEYRQVLDMVETIMLVGEPSLNPKKPDEWIELISECVSRRKGLPAKLATGITVGCLQKISDRFEEIMLFSTVFDVLGSGKRGQKRKFRMKRTEHDGCIGCATVHVRLFSTSSEELLLDSSPGDISICPFHPKSAHFGHLLTLNLTPSLPQIEASGTNDPTMDNMTEATNGVTAESIISQDLPARLEEIPEGGATVQTTEAQPITVLVNTADGDDENNLEVDESPSGEDNIGGTGSNRIDNTNEIPTSQPDTEVDTADETSHQASLEGVSEISGPTEEIEAVTSITPASSISGHRNQDGDLSPVWPHTSQASLRERKKCYSSFIPERDSLFYGRAEILKELEEILIVPHDAYSSQTSIHERGKPNLVCLRGLGGIGKTAIASEFVYRFMHKFHHVIWLNASSEANLGRYCHDSAVALGLVNGRLSQDHQVSRLNLMEFLRDWCAPWLLILDNYGDGVDISPYLPNDSTCSVVVTARDQPITLPTTVWSVINVPGFTSEEATRFLAKCIDAEITAEDAEAICRAAVRFHISPLVCRQLTKWCARGSVSFKDITLLLEETDSLARRFESPVHFITSSVLGQLSHPATSLLQDLCFYDGCRVSKRLVRTTQSRRLKIVSRTETEFDQTFSEAASRLVRLAMVDIEGPRHWSCPSIIQDSVRGQLDDESWSEGFNEACSSIWYHWPSSRKLKNIMGGFWEDFDQLHSHVHHLAGCLVLDRLDGQAASYDPGEEFTRLLVYHTWYNSRRGNQSEDRNLHDLAQFLITNTRRQPPTNSKRTIPRRWLQVMDDEGFTARLVESNTIPDSPYIALSYQWGSSPPHLNTTTFNSHKFDISTLPQQISDAISFTRNIGYKYLWVDSICIDNTNPTEVSEVLPHLLDYYTNASMTFCALEKDAGRFRRVPLRWKKSQRLDISSYSILRSSPEESSPWARALILQERCLAPVVITADLGCVHISGQGRGRFLELAATSTPEAARRMWQVSVGTRTSARREDTLVSRNTPEYEGRRSWLTRRAKVVVPDVFLLPALGMQMYVILATRAQAGIRAVVKFGQEHPQLRYYLVSFLLVICSVCFGNCMPRFIV